MTRPLFTASFWLDTLERTIRTAAQVLLGTMGGSQVALSELDWQLVAWSTAGAAAICVLMCVVASGVGEPGTASVMNRAPPGTASVMNRAPPDTLKDEPVPANG